MGNTFIGGLYIVAATNPETGERKLFVAATLRDQAVEAVKRSLPSSAWKLELTTRHLTQAEANKLKLRPSEVCEWRGHQ